MFINPSYQALRESVDVTCITVFPVRFRMNFE